MSIHADFGAGVLITNGLGSRACSNLIIGNKFHMFGCLEIIIPPITSTPGTGGSIPLAPGQIQNFYKPITTPDYYIKTDIDPLAKPKQLVIVKLTINDKIHEKEFLLKEKPYKLLINILNLENTTFKKIKIIIDNLHIKLHNILIKIKKLRKIK